jgi:oligopeptidase A
MTPNQAKPRQPGADPAREQPNPLLATDGLPDFDTIRPGHVLPATRICIDRARSAITAVTQPGPRDFDGVVVPVERLGEALAAMWSPVRHLHSVMDSPALREAYEAALPLLTDFHTDLTQNRALFEAYRAVADTADTLSAPQRRAVDHALRDFELGGVSLEGEARERFKVIAARLAELASGFSNNVLDATHAFSITLTDESRLEGLPESARALAAQAASAAGEQGWRLTLDLPSYLPVMSFASDRALREQMYRAYVTRASDQGPHAGEFDNTPLIAEILSLRQEQARLLGFDSYARLSLDRKMAAEPETVLGFLLDLAARSRPVAERELEELTVFARDEHGIEQLEAWDIPYYSEKLRSARYAFSQEDLRPYFPLPRVIEGMFQVASRLFEVSFEAVGGVSVWHPDVLFYRVLAAHGECLGEVYLDLYARTGKRGGAWMDVCRSRWRLEGASQRPVAYLTCNFTPPVGDSPALITHDEVTTLFHEFGHGLHHLLTRVDLPSLSGIAGVEWDAVELPSQLLENWCFELEPLALISAHHETGEPLPESLLSKLRSARNFQSGLQMLRQVEFALFDFRIHLQPEGEVNVLETLSQVREQVAVIRPPAFNRFPHSFSHIFAGGYAAGYYSYKWAEVLASDAYACFEENGVFDAVTGARFRDEVLARGGTRDAMQSFVAFRGREPDISALLRHCGIESVTAEEVA